MRHSFRRRVLLMIAGLIRNRIRLRFGEAADAWIRNSLRLRYDNRDCDLDLSIQIPERGREEARRIASWLGRWRIGECAVYQAEDKQWVHLANPLEISRDPLLLQKWEVPAPLRASHAESLVFLLRMEAADSHLRDPSREARRLGKWQHHFSLASRLSGLALPELQAKALQATVSRAIQELLARALSASPGDLISEPDFFLHPPRWLGEARRNGKRIQPRKPGAPLLSEIQEAQIRWEMWGLLGQARLMPTGDGVIEHFHFLFQMLPRERAEGIGAYRYLRYLRGLF